jgi:hypothetical protein
LTSSRTSTIWFGVEAARRLVEDQHVGLVHHRLGEADALAIALRQLEDVLAGHEREAAQPDDPVDLGPDRAARHAPDLGGEAQVVVDPHLGVERRRLGQVADLAAHLERVLDDVEPVDRGLAGTRQQVAGQDLHRRRLPGAVGAQEADDLAPRDLEGDSLQGLGGAVQLRQILNVDHRTIRTLVACR